VPYNPLFYSFLFIGLNTAILFIEKVKLSEEIIAYLDELQITTRPYSDIWSFLRRREWGEGKVSTITPFLALLLKLTLFEDYYISSDALCCCTSVVALPYHSLALVHCGSHDNQEPGRD